MFVIKLYNNDKNGKFGTYRFPLWKGLHDIKDDETFLKYCKILLTHMWH